MTCASYQQVVSLRLYQHFAHQDVDEGIRSEGQTTELAQFSLGLSPFGRLGCTKCNARPSPVAGKLHIIYRGLSDFRSRAWRVWIDADPKVQELNRTRFDLLAPSFTLSS